jgi:class 3 adenylate cyclase
MAQLDAAARAALPDTAFAYVDSRGERRLPINDEAHVRNALSRFGQVKFESDAAKDRAFEKLVKAAVEHGIAPIGFLASRLREARASDDTAELPSGQVTLMLTDIEASTHLVEVMGPDYGSLLEQVRALIRTAVEDSGGYEVDARADEYFAVFASAILAVVTAVSIQEALDAASWPEPVRVRIGLHSGDPARTDTGYIGMPVHVAARVCSAGHGGQILVSAATVAEVGDHSAGSIRFESLGRYSLHGVTEPLEVFQVVGAGLDDGFPPLRTPAVP